MDFHDQRTLIKYIYFTDRFILVSVFLPKYFQSKDSCNLSVLLPRIWMGKTLTLNAIEMT
jgi:hypothetical protein